MNGTVRILHVDDDPDRLAEVSATLERAADPNEVLARDGVERALDAFETGPIDCLVAATGVEGLELLAGVRPGRPRLPTVVYGDRRPTIEPAATDVAYVHPVDDGLAERIDDAIGRVLDGAPTDPGWEAAAGLPGETSREGIETTVCDRLAASDRYRLAWIGEYRPIEGRILPRTVAGDDGWSPGPITVDDGDGSIDGGSEGRIDGESGEATDGGSEGATDGGSEGATDGGGEAASGNGGGGTAGGVSAERPVAAAVRTGEPRYAGYAPDEPVAGPWPDGARVRSTFVVPIVDGETTCGVLAVYADGVGAFDAAERRSLAALGDAIADAYRRVRGRERYETQYRELFEDAPVMIALTRETGDGPVIEDVNRLFADRLGYEREELAGRPLADVYAERSARRLLEEGGYERALSSEFVTQERGLIARDGRQLTTLLQASPRRRADGEVVGTIALYVDVTDRRRAREVIEQAEAMEASMDGMAILDPEGSYVYLNEAHAEIYGYDDPAALVGESWRRLYDEEEADRLEREALSALETAGEWRGEATGLRADGSRFPQEVSLTRTEDGAIVCVVRDVSERKDHQKELERQNDLFTRAQRIANIGVWEFDVRTEEWWWSDQVRRIYGLDPDADPDPDGGFDRVHPDDRPALVEGFDRAVDGGAGYDLDFRIETADGECRWVRVRGEPQFADGEVSHVRGTFQDITGRKRRERELERREERLRVLFDRAPDAIVVHDDEGTVLDVNDRTVDLLGYSRAELLSMNVSAFEVEYDPTELREFWERMDPEGTARTVGTQRRADGSTFPAEIWLNEIEIDGESRYLAIMRDITERKAYERSLEDARAELRQVIDLVPDLIFVKDRSGEYVLANETTADYYGRSVAEVEGRTDRELLPDEDQARAFRADDLAVIHSGEPTYVPEEELTTADGETRILETTKIPYTAASGEPAILGYARDVTELKRYERQLERQRDNLDVLNKVVRHDIRNELQLVLAYAETLADSVEGGNVEYVNQVLASARKAVDITESARDVAEVTLQADAEPTRIRLRYVLEGAVDDVRSGHHDVVVTTAGSIPDVEVLADETLESVFRNLLKNAVEHNDAEIPRVTVSATERNGSVVVRVADNGPGIPDGRKADIFEEGEKDIDSGGTGLGLYLVDTLVDRYGGDVRIEDNEPRGSVFVVSLPVDG